jgi:hypothetical protein
LPQKIWRAIGIFVVGFVFTTVLQQTRGVGAEEQLQNTSEPFFQRLFGPRRQMLRFSAL